MDARRLGPGAQEDLRRRVVCAVREDGMGKSRAARTFGVSRQSIDNWLARVTESGFARGLAARKRGPKPRPRLRPHQERQAVGAIRGGCPDRSLLPFALWTREAVVALLRRRFGLSVSVWTAGRYLRRWGLTPQRPARRAYERDPAAVRRWLAEEYPAVRARAKASKALILWGDEMGLRSDDPVGRTYAPRGQTPVVPAAGRRFGCNMISAINNLGRLWFMVFAGRFTSAVFTAFLGRLLRAVPARRLILVVDSHPVHKSAAVRRWLAGPAAAGRVELVYLPGYSPELNPDELLNQDTKQAIKKCRPADQREMMDQVRSHLRSRQKRPDVVRRFFHEEHVRYAAA